MRPALIAVLVLAPAIAHAAPQVLYLNFSDGTETMTLGDVDDAPRNVSSISGAAPFPSFVWPTLVDSSQNRAEVVRTIARRVHELFLPYNVLVTTVRPATGPYTMVMIGGSPVALGFDPRVGGLAFLDCGNAQPSNVVYAFPEALRGSMHGLTVTIAQEAAHGWGLEHTNNPRDLMFPRLDPLQASFPDMDAPISGEQHCGGASQNSHRRLIQLVGAWPGDEKPFDDGSSADRVAPRVSIIEPAEGASLVQPFTVRVTAEDEAGVDRVVLAAGEARRTERRAPYAWSLDGFAAGSTTVSITAYDANGNAAVSTVRVNLEAPTGGGCRVAGGSQGLWMFVLGAGLLGWRNGAENRKAGRREDRGRDDG